VFLVFLRLWADDPTSEHRRFQNRRTLKGMHLCSGSVNED
jgi:hypothetical protein